MPRKRIFTQEEKERMITSYNDGVTVREIAKRIGISIPLASKTLKEWGVNVVNKTQLVYFDIEKDIVPLVEAGYSLSQIAPMFKTERHTLSEYLKKAGYKVINRQNETKFDETVFDTIDTEEKAYWLGFLFADGYLSSPRKNGKHEYEVELSLAIVDIDHLYKFQKFLKFNHDRVRYSRVSSNVGEYYRCRLSFANKHVWEKLNGYGCTPVKSLTLKFPAKEVFVGDKEKLIMSFIKGYFEGDGTLSYTYGNTSTGKRYSAITSMLGTKDFLEKVAEELIVKKSIKLVNKKSVNSSGKTYSLFIRQKDTQRLIHLFYDNSQIHLERKYKRALFFKERTVSNDELVTFLEEENRTNGLIKEEYTKDLKHETNERVCAG